MCAITSTREGDYEAAVPPGRYRIEVVRGIDYEADVQFTEVGAGITHVHDFEVSLLRDMRAAGWYSGNTHTHYHLEIDENPDDRLRMVPPAEGLDVSCISYLIRNDSPYISNRYPVGRLPEFSKHGTLMDMGEEARNNSTFGTIGYGHCLFLDIPRLVEPVSTGLLSWDGKAHDFPTLSMLCEEAKSIGGITHLVPQRDGHGATGHGGAGASGCLQPGRWFGRGLRTLLLAAERGLPASGVVGNGLVGV